MQVSRFLGLIQRARDEIPRASSRLLAYTLACIELDYLHGQNFAKVHLRGETTAPETAGQTTSTKKLGAEEKAVRSGCQNTMVLACIFWSEPSNHTKLRIVSTCTRSMLAWHKKQNSELRSTDASGPFVLQQVSGGFLRTLAECFSVLRREDDLAFCRFELPDRVGWVHPLGDIGLAEEEAHAQAMAGLVFSIVGQRLKRMAWMLRGWPAQSALFLGDWRQQERCGKEFMDDLDAFEYCQSLADDNRALKAMVERSCMNDIAVQQLEECYKAEGNPPTDRFQKWCKDLVLSDATAHGGKRVLEVTF